MRARARHRRFCEFVQKLSKLVRAKALPVESGRLISDDEVGALRAARRCIRRATLLIDLSLGARTGAAAAGRSISARRPIGCRRRAVAITINWPASFAGAAAIE